jgi:hypothetical protein
MVPPFLGDASEEAAAGFLSMINLSTISGCGIIV